ncbi:MAG: hypothetical protein H5T93_09395 [Pseudothermotoga sp.]|uniref:DUF7670 domain-containing protein n=1 Tax=Pseudothermotoga sp. TaxID=2033661 RepID=UPI000AD0230C|nr:hypothetical protein [Pseudothermotoga sp.]HBT39530.1 hypothetical protein [Pseudothermotoga sp.]HCO98526.1 hypothetical protein [Pseudothermotoga sp.]
MKKGLVFWLPRLLSILFLLFLFMLSFDVFEEGRSTAETFIGFLIHNIPVFALLVPVLLAWKRDLVGAITFLVVGLLFIVFVTYNVLFREEVSWDDPILSILTISGPAFLTAFLYFKSWKSRRDTAVKD